MLRCGNNLKKRNFPEPTDFDGRSSAPWTKSRSAGLILTGTGHFAFCPRAARPQKRPAPSKCGKKQSAGRYRPTESIIVRDATRLTLCGNRTMTFAGVIDGGRFG